MLCLKLVFLVSYFILVFLCFRVIEFYVTSFGGREHILKCLCTTNELIAKWLSPFDYCRPEQRQQKNEQSRSFNSSDDNIDLNESTDDKSISDDIVFSGYEEYIEKVEDTKASVWVVLVYPTGSTLSHSWTWLTKRLKQNGIKTGHYECYKDIRLCLKHKINLPTVILSMPKGSRPKGKVAFHLFYLNQKVSRLKNAKELYHWVQTRLYPKVKTVHSISELTQQSLKRASHQHKLHDEPSLFFIYKSNIHTPPLLLTALSVKFTGRVKFYMLKSNADVDTEHTGNVLAMNKAATYKYGEHRGENFSYSCLELFLRTLHPEVNDIFIASLILLNMVCWLEVSLQKGGPLRRLLFYIWGFATSNILLVSIWLPLIQLLYMPQVQPIIEVCLKSLQQMMFTNFAAIIRQDILQLSKHLHIIFAGFICYGIFLGYLLFKFRNEEEWPSDYSFSSIFEHDIQELRELFQSFLPSITSTSRLYRFEERIERVLHHLSTSDLWLPVGQSFDYIKQLPTWRYCNKLSGYTPYLDAVTSDSEFCSESDYYSESSNIEDKSTVCTKKCNKIVVPSYILPASECVICLDKYKCRQFISGLPCGHSFHKNCVISWLLSEAAQKRCPICRWPSNVEKNDNIEVIDLIE